MRFIPTGDRLLIKPDDAEKETKFGLLIPETAAEKMYRGTVVESAKPAYLAGCHVMFSKYGGTEIKLDGESLIVVSERDVLGVLEED
jgi:chaperonin GroES